MVHFICYLFSCLCVIWQELTSRLPMVVYALMPRYMLNELKLMHCDCLDNLKLMRLGVDIQKMKIDCER
jgi:hypothetical protein